MQYSKLFCLLNFVALATAAGFFGGLGIDSQGIGAQAGAIFPKIPGINAPLFPSLPGHGRPRGPGGRPPPGGPGGRPPPPPPPPPPQEGQQQQQQQPQQQQQLSDLTAFPDITRLVPSGLPNGENATSIYVPPITESSSNSSLPGVAAAIQDARNHISTALNLGNDFATGIQTALEEAFQSGDSTQAVRTIVNTILNAFLTVALNCPVIGVGNAVLQEGIRLAQEVARTARNVSIRD